MNRVFITVLFVLVVQGGWSQMEMKLKPRLSIQNGDSVPVKRSPFFNKSSVLVLDSSRVSHSVPTGLVYTLPQDNMPWLKPGTDLVYNMHIQKATGNDNMPNAYQRPQNELLQSLRKQFQKDKK